MISASSRADSQSSPSVNIVTQEAGAVQIGATHGALQRIEAAVAERLCEANDGRSIHVNPRHDLAGGAERDVLRVADDQVSKALLPVREPLEARNDLLDRLLRRMRFMIGHRVTSRSPIPASHDAWRGQWS
jgi:hypothetical protein